MPVRRGPRLTTWIIAGAIGGILVGYACHLIVNSPEDRTQVAGHLSILSDIFLRAIKMIIAPLVFATLTAGIANAGGRKALGRLGVRTLLWFVVASIVSLLLGIFLVQLFQPGAGLDLTLPHGDAPEVSAPFDLSTFITHIVPRSIFEAMATNEILQIVVFSIFAGVALSGLGEKGAPLMRGVDALVELMLKITGYVMWIAPFAAFASIAAVVVVNGPGILLTFGKFIGSFYVSLIVLWLILVTAGFVVLGRPASWRVVRAVREPLLVAFTTASSEAAYPKTLESLERIGIPRRIAGFVLPLGYSFNLDGSMMYCTFALLFIAQVYGIDLTLGQQVTMLLLLMVASKGTAGVPRASLVIVAAALPHFDLPDAGLFLILGADQFLDMGRTATNVLGNSIATAAVAKWEGVTVRAGTTDDAGRQKSF